MRKSNSTLLMLLSPPSDTAIVPSLEKLDPRDLAHLYVSVAFLRSALDFLGEQFWLRSQQEGSFSFPEFLAPFLAAELEPITFLHEFLKNSSNFEGKALKVRLRAIEGVLIEVMIERPFSEQKIFAQQALQLMEKLFAFETRLQGENFKLGTHLGLSLYRTFDGLDQLFGLNYALDKNVKQDLLEPERLYEGAGVGVQSGCSTVLTALRHLDPTPGSRFIDLGSGYGRVGLLIGLLRPDLQFTGYEFVKERVAVANRAVENLGMQSHVSFLTQDLAAKDFFMPEAEIYYLYDPFSESTYRKVLAQLVEVSHRMKITIATKGNARHWLSPVAEREGWPLAQEFDSGNLCLYCSRI